LLVILPEDPPQFFKAPFNSHDITVLDSLLTANGFDRIEIQAIPMKCHSLTAESLEIGMVEGTPILAEIQERGGASGPIVDAVAAAFARIGRDSPFRSTMQAIVVTARARG